MIICQFAIQTAQMHPAGPDIGVTADFVTARVGLDAKVCYELAVIRAKGDCSGRKSSFGTCVILHSFPLFVACSHFYQQAPARRFIL